MNVLVSLFNSLPGAAGQGLIWGIMAIGVYITYKILDVADLTVDGSLATGGAVAVRHFGILSIQSNTVVISCTSLTSHSIVLYKKVFKLYFCTI